MAVLVLFVRVLLGLGAALPSPAGPSVRPVAAVGSILAIEIPGADFFKQLVKTILDWLLDEMREYFNFLFALWQAFKQWVVYEFYELYKWMRQYCKQQFGLDPDPQIRNIINQFEYLADMIQDANAVLPITAVFVIFMSSLSVCIVLRIVRWIKSFVPMVGD